ncbi:MAG TPA: alpha/beta hydrolase [Streptosporangiaceae bacterium]|jgi:hypothetical protein|nr:alpha/beta hydrolase [Streptosporangiaceae bacterium]
MSTQFQVPSADTQLHTVDTPGGTPALLFLNGAFGTMRDWHRVISQLGGKYRAVQFDARARGKSGRSAGYSIAGAIDDVGRVIAAARTRAHAQFRRIGWMMRILAAFGRSAHMSPDQAADVTIEVDQVNGELGPDLAALRCPVAYVVGTGPHPGAGADEMATMRAAAAEAEAADPRMFVSATTSANHVQILAKTPEAVVAAIESVVHDSK